MHPLISPGNVLGSSLALSTALFSNTLLADDDWLSNNEIKRTLYRNSAEVTYLFGGNRKGVTYFGASNDPSDPRGRSLVPHPRTGEGVLIGLWYVKDNEWCTYSNYQNQERLMCIRFRYNDDDILEGWTVHEGQLVRAFLYEIFEGDEFKLSDDHLIDNTIRECPVLPPVFDPHWTTYETNSIAAWAFGNERYGQQTYHCNFKGFRENVEITSARLENECFYDDYQNLVTKSHPYSGCRGTANTEYHGVDVWYDRDEAKAYTEVYLEHGELFSQGNYKDYSGNDPKILYFTNPCSILEKCSIE